MLLDIMLTAGNRENCRDIFSNPKMQKPDIILMDIRVGDKKDGFKAADIIRSQFDIPIIFSMTQVDDEDMKRAKITMPFGYILKPFQKRDLETTIEMSLYAAKIDNDRKKAEQTSRNEKMLSDELIESLPGLFKYLIRIVLLNGTVNRNW